MFCTDISAPIYFIFSSSTPELLYYSHIPTSIIALVVGFFVFYKDRRSLVSSLLLTLGVLFFVWSVFDLILWTNIDSGVILFYWSLINLVEVLVSVCTLYFAYVFIEKKDLSFNIKLLFVLILFPFVFFIPTTLNLSGFKLEICEADQGVLLKYFYFLESLFSLILINYLSIKIIREKRREKRSALVYFSIGIILFLVSFSGVNIVSSFTEKWELLQYGLFGMPIFMGFLGYLIVRFKTFNIKVFGAQALVTALVAIIASEYFFVDSLVNFILVGITLILALGFGYILTKSVKRDIQQKEELEALSQQLVEANIQLKKLDKAKSEFISIASHQLRTPLTAIKGYLSLVVEGSYGQVDDSVKNALQKAYGANERLILLVEDLLNASRIESGRMKYDLADVRLEDLVSQSCDSLALKAEDEGLFLKVNAPKDPLPIFHVDGNKVREVISNFIDNAIKYTEKGGVEVGFESDSESVKVVVSDTGIGVPEDEIPYLFKKFSRGKDTSRLNATGTGLGLFVAKNIIEAHGGKVWVKSDGAGKGSRFYIQLPLKWIDPNTNAEVGMKEGE